MFRIPDFEDYYGSNRFARGFTALRAHVPWLPADWAEYGLVLVFIAVVAFVAVNWDAPAGDLGQTVRSIRAAIGGCGA